MKKNKVEKIFTGAANPSRRNFLKNSGALAAALAAAPMATLAFDDKTKAAGDKLIGIQLGAVSFMDEGVEKVLDILQQRAGVNAIFMSTFCYDRGLNGRQMPGQPFPDHGSQESDEKTYHGGFYATPHAKFYDKTAIKGDKMIAPDFGAGGVDVLARVIPVAKKKGIKVFANVLDTWGYPEDLLATQLKDFVEIDLQGEHKKTICFFRPDVREFWKAVVTDIASSYDIDGIMFFNERNGPLINAVGATHSESFSSSHVTCFCDAHKRTAQERGINFERAKEGYHKLDEFVQRSLRNERPSDGYYVEFQRLILQYPEILAYQQLFDYGKHRILEDVRDAIKAVNKNLQVGFHIEHVNSWNPFYRAGRNYEALASMTDLLKVVVYNNCAGERYANFIRNIQSSIFRDVPAEELMRFNNHLLNYGNEASLDQLPAAGFSPDYVYRETARAIAGVKGKCKVLPGIDIGIPTEAHSRKASPDDTYAATMAAFKAQPDGVIFSRKYSEMMLANLDAAGRAVKDAAKV
ncbi:MAG TPA: twin-arginine translocation signal domain-containing protein [Puia sp.]